MDAVAEGLLGVICTPRQGTVILPCYNWAGDSGAFNDNYVGDAAYLQWMWRWRHLQQRCAFVTAPDVVCDPVGTLERSAPMMPRIRALGYKVAFVGQDGLEHMEAQIPWSEFDVFFIGGSTAWKLGSGAQYLATEAQLRGKAAHMGRVNGLHRMRHAYRMGCASVDGTYLKFGPDKHLDDLLRWVQKVNSETVNPHHELML